MPKGWTLVELLVSMALGLLIIAGIGQIYLAAKRSYEIQYSIAQLQEVGRYATEVLTQDIRRAGYWGLANIDAFTLAAYSGYASPDNAQPPDETCPNGNDFWGRMITGKVVGLNDTAVGYNCLNSNYKQGDIITLRYADPSPITAFDPDTLYLRSTPFRSSLVFGDPGLCTPPAVGCTYVNLVPAADTVFSDNKVEAHAYYVTNSSTATQCGDPSAPALPALAQESLSTGPSTPGFPVKSELVTGVEQLQFQYGVDFAMSTMTPAGDGSVDQYFNANQINIACGGGSPCWDQVRSVRFWILVRTDCPDGSYTDNNTYNMGDLPPYTPNDSFRRALYTSTVSIRN